MLKTIKNLLFLFSFALLSCVGAGDPVDEEDLTFDFENIWWEMIDEPVLLTGGGVYCYYFDTTRVVEAPDDGVILIYEEEDNFSHILSNFERIEGGYYLSSYDAILEIFFDEYGNFSMKISKGVYSHQSDIIPCSLGS